MAAYLVVDTLLEDPEGYEQYKILAKPIVEKYGGQYMVRGGAITLRESDLWTPTRMVLIEFPDVQAANRFYDSPEYQTALRMGRDASKRTLFIVEGL